MITELLPWFSSNSCPIAGWRGPASPEGVRMVPMANGKPGDHPLTDILVHEMEVFGPAADALIREICELGGEAELESRFNLLSIDPRFPRPGRPPPDMASFESRLRRLRDELRADAVRRGWEVPDP
jgi:hypothetical protein